MQEAPLKRAREPLPTRVQDLPPLPTTYARTLDAGLEALDLDLDRRVRDAIDSHVRLLLAWTASVNLTAIRDPEAAARLHVLDSLAALPLIRARGASQLLDIGSGGGFPGLPLAAAIPADRALLVDSVGKKVSFLETAIAATGLADRATAIKARVESVAHDTAQRGAWPIVTARAVASLWDLVELALPLVAPGGVLVAWKREPLGPELKAAGPALAALRAGRVELVSVPVPGLGSHRLVVVPRGGDIDARYPRDPVERRRHPLRSAPGG